MTRHTVCHLVAPRASAASLCERGTALSASSEVRISVGSSRQARVRAPERMEKRKCRAVTNNTKPKSPKTMDGTPASTSVPYRMMPVNLLAGAYSARQIAAPTPSGISMAMVRAMR